MKIDSNYFLPYFGMCSPLYDVEGYNIGGFRDGMPIDMPVEEILYNFDLADKMRCNLNDTSIDSSPTFSSFCSNRGSWIYSQKTIYKTLYYYSSIRACSGSDYF